MRAAPVRDESGVKASKAVSPAFLLIDCPAGITSEERVFAPVVTIKVLSAIEVSPVPPWPTVTAALVVSTVVLAAGKV